MREGEESKKKKFYEDEDYIGRASEDSDEPPKNKISIKEIISKVKGNLPPRQPINSSILPSRQNIANNVMHGSSKTGNIKFDLDDYPYLYYIEMLGKEEKYSDYKREILDGIIKERSYLAWGDECLSALLANIENVIDKLRQLDPYFSNHYFIHLEANIPRGIKEVYPKVTNNIQKVKQDFESIRECIYNFILNYLRKTDRMGLFIFMNKNDFWEFTNFLMDDKDRKEVLTIRSLVDIYEVDRMQDKLYSNYYLQIINGLKDELKDEEWFKILCELRRFVKVGKIINILSNLYNISPQDLSSLLFSSEICNGIKHKFDFSDLKTFFLLNSLSVCNNYTECKNILDKIYGDIQQILSSLGLLNSQQLNVKLMPVLKYIYMDLDYNKPNLIITLDTLNFPVTAHVLNKLLLDNTITYFHPKSVAIITLPPKIFGLKSEGSSNEEYVQLFTNDDELEFHPIINKLMEKFREKFKIDIKTRHYNYTIIDEDGKPISLAELQQKMRERKTSVVNRSKGVLNQPANINTISINRNGVPKYIQLDTNFLGGFKKMASLVYASDRGTTIIVYDENKPGIEDSLAYLATEIASINGYETNPITISNKDDLSRDWRVPNVGIAAGIFVLKKDLCEANDNVKKALQNSLNGIMGYKYSIIIMPKCLYDEFKLIIGGKAKVIQEDLSREVISTLAYLSSGFQINLKTYDALANVREPYENLLSEARSWLDKNYICKDVGGEKESDLHRNLKAVAIKHLIEIEKIKVDEIHVEEYVDDLKPDILTPNLVVDAKTSIGIEPNDELSDLKKYSKLSNRIWAVMKPIAVLLDLDRIIGRINEAAKQGIEMKVMIPVKDDKYGSKLISLENFIKEGRNYYSQQTT
ncbi:hypothetical protein [Saccharolobus islandicus]|uniref:hypothetical protein n=1 Tax=Saccharolobus islandicus TaxID=43080 RepID=UPI00241C212F|nr:hypothetical protein [Sulfolobus islandicus]